MCHLQALVLDAGLAERAQKALDLESTLMLQQPVIRIRFFGTLVGVQSADRLERPAGAAAARSQWTEQNISFL